jgi:hypothetical protein
MNSKATMTFSTLAIAAVALLFASGPIAASDSIYFSKVHINTYMYLTSTNLRWN